MTPLEEQVSKILNPGPWKHDFLRRLNPNGVSCIKCDVGLSQQDTICPVPPTYRIPTDRSKDPKAYDLCLGQALVEFRKTCPDISNKDMGKIIKPMMHPNWRIGTSPPSQIILNLTWVLFKATALQLWEIVIRAKELK